MKEALKVFLRIWKGKPQSLRQKRIEVVISLVVLVIVLTLDRLGPSGFGLATNVLGSHITNIVIAVLAIASGITAHWFKGKEQRWYGFVEVLFGGFSAASIAFALSPQKASLTQWASLVGCSYVVARGLNNMSEAKKKLSIGTSAASHT